jgi:hypothetical protein
MTCVWPVGFNRHDIEAVLLDQSLGDRSPASIKVVSAMAGFPDHHHPRISVAVEHFTKGFGVRFRQGLGVLTQERGDGGLVNVAM